MAVIKLAAGTGTIRERLEEAYSLALAALELKDFPEEELKRQFLKIHDTLAQVLPIAERTGHLSLAMDALSEKQIEELAQQVVSLFYRTIQLEESPGS